jgi:hypothetical protein
LFDDVNEEGKEMLREGRWGGIYVKLSSYRSSQFGHHLGALHGIIRHARLEGEGVWTGR